MRRFLLYAVGGIIVISTIGGIIRNASSSNGSDANPSASPVLEEVIESAAETNDDGVQQIEPEREDESFEEPVAEEAREVEKVEPSPSPEPTALEEPTRTEPSSDNTLLVQLNALTVTEESAISPYDRGEFPHWDDEDGDGMNTRVEVLSEEKIENAGWYSRWDGIWYEGEGGLSAPSFDIDHIVALSEAWDSGASEWNAYDRDIFADYRLNLVAVSSSSNRSKGGRDAGEWLPPDPLGKCFLAIRVIQVKSNWELSIDQGEYDVLRDLLTDCGSEIPQVPDLETVTPIPSPNTSMPTPQNSYGSQYYITANGVDIDQYDSNRNGDINCGELPASARPVIVINLDNDPYRLDQDSDGTGCE